MLGKHPARVRQHTSMPLINGLIVRMVWRLVAASVRFNRFVDSPARFRCYTKSDLIAAPDKVAQLISCYQEVFRTSAAWSEEHSSTAVESRIMNALEGDAVLATMDGKGAWPIAGFCWGQLLDSQGVVLASREMPSFGRATEAEWSNLDVVLTKRLGGRKALYVHEFGIHKSFRAGISSLQFLIRPLLEMSNDAGVCQAVWWTSRDSEAFQLSLVLGFEVVCEVGGLVYLHTPDTKPVLGVVSHLSRRAIAKVMLMSRRLKGT